MPELRTEVLTVNMGPQHPSTHGVLRLVLELDGETVLSIRPTIGYLHTGIEKTAEQKKWQQVIPLVERMDYLSAQSNSFSFALQQSVVIPNSRFLSWSDFMDDEPCFLSVEPPNPDNSYLN